MIKSAGTLEITTRIGCKVDCVLCPQLKLIQEYSKCSNVNVLTMEIYKNCIDKVPASVRIDFSGMAEPWLNPDATQMLLYAAQKGHRIAVYTTLVGMTIDDFNRIKGIDFTEFVIHLPDIDGNSKIMVTAEYLQLLQCIVSTAPDKLKQLLKFCAHGPTPAEVRKIVDVNMRLSIHDRAGNVEDSGGIKMNRVHHRGRIQCCLSGIDLNHNVLLPDGRVVLCCMDYGMEYIMGNLMQDKYSDVLVNEKKEFIRQHLDYEQNSVLCRKCSFAMPKRRIFSISMVKNEEDIIESFVRYHMNIFDGMVVVDNGSCDDTKSILESLRAEGLPLYIYDDPETNYLQDAKMSQILHAAMKTFQPELIVPLDADEFIVANESKSPRAVLEDVDLQKLHYVKWRTYIPDESDDPAELVTLLKMQHMRQEQYEKFYKVMVSKYVMQRQSLQLAMGSHDVVFPNNDGNNIGKTVVEELRIAHFPLRSIDQLKSKIYVGWVNSLSRYDRKAGEGFHWEVLFNSLMEGGEITVPMLAEMAKHYDLADKEVEVKTQQNPVNLSHMPSITLKYTRSNTINYTRNLAQNAACLAQEYSLQKKKVISTLGPLGNLVQVLFKNNMFKEALSCTEIALLFGANPIWLFNKAELHMKLGEIDPAVETFVKFVSSADSAQYPQEIKRAKSIIELVNKEKAKTLTNRA
jgi:radical SAM protein with 4Fe4S-binding SPASM domain